MEILIAIGVVAYFLIREKFQEYKASKYADQMMKMRNRTANLEKSKNS